MWNAEYRISLMRNFEISLDNRKRSGVLDENVVSQLKQEECEGRGGEGSLDGCIENLDTVNAECLRNLSPEVLNCIQQLESELSSVKQVISLAYFFTSYLHSFYEFVIMKKCIVDHFSVES